MATLRLNGSLLLVAILFSFLSTRHIAVCRADSAAGTQDALVAGGAGGGQSRTIYSQKHLSPHRMMHFGKRPLIVEPPSIFVSADQEPLVDLPVYRTSGQEQEQQQQGQLQDATLISYDPLRQIFEETYPFAVINSRNKHLIDVVSNMLEYAKQQQQLKERARNQELAVATAAPEQQRTPVIKFMKLTDGSGIDSDEQQASQEKRSGNEQAQREAAGAQEADINVASRSLPMARGESGVPAFSRAHLSSILYGRRLNEAPRSLMSLGNYIKKAEPQTMKFMHFG